MLKKPANFFCIFFFISNFCIIAQNSSIGYKNSAKSPNNHYDEKFKNKYDFLRNKYDYFNQDYFDSNAFFFRVKQKSPFWGKRKPIFNTILQNNLMPHLKLSLIREIFFSRNK